MPSSALRPPPAAPPSPAGARRALGRFAIREVLGRGAQGVVYRAHDPVLEREVAIKALRATGAGAEALLHEARMASQLKHPNIVPVFEVGEAEGAPFLVSELVPGESLRERLAREPQPALHDALRWAAEILGALECAHAAGIVHRDLNPRNVRITGEGIARVMDFGVCTFSGTTTLPGEPIVGTARYLAPEQLDGGALTGATDCFAVGLVLYEMLTGAPVADGDAIAAMWKIAHEPIEPASRRNPRVDPELDRVVMRALEKAPEDRYPSARAFREAIEAHRATAAAGDESAHGSTIAFLMRRMRRKQDFPAVAAHVAELRRKTSAPTRASVSELANIVLKDYALSTKLLKLVNSSYYGQYGGRISTISRAVVILGFDQVRMAAMSMLLFEHIDDGPQAEELRESAARAFLSGALSRELAESSSIAEPEEAFVCAMLRNLGRYAAIYYLPEEYAEIEKTVAARGVPEAKAAHQVLGVSYDELGVAVAREWQLPAVLTDVIRGDAAPPDEVPKRPEEAVRAIAAYANELCEALSDSTSPDREAAVAAVHKRFSKCVPLPAKARKGALERAVGQAAELADAMGPGLAASRSLARSRAFLAGAPPAESPAAKAPAGDSERTRPGAAAPPERPAPRAGAAAQPSADERTITGMRGDRRSALINGIQDVTNALLEGCGLNDVLVMVIETMYRGIGFNRVVFCIADRKHRRMVARFGLGADIDRIVRRFYFPLENGGDAFSRAIAEQVDVVYPGSGCSLGDLPVWYREVAAAPRFAALPIVVNRVTVGMIYCDHDGTGRSIDGDELNYLNALRNQAALAIKQSR